MTDKLNWISFRTLHKGLPKKTQSAAWAAYKENDEVTYTSQFEDLDFDIPEEIKEYFIEYDNKIQVSLDNIPDNLGLFEDTEEVEPVEVPDEPVEKSD